MKSAVARAPQTTQANQVQEFSREGRLRYIWSPRRLDCASREIGHLFVPAKEFVQIADLHGRKLDTSIEAFSGQAENDHGLVPFVKTSLKIVDELLNQWGEQGLVYLKELDDVAPTLIAEFESALIPSPNATLVAIHEHLLTAPEREDRHAELFSSVRRALLAGVEQSLSWHQQQVQTARDEYAGRMRGEVGIPSFTPWQKQMAREIGEELREGERIQVEAPAQTGNPVLDQVLAQMAQSQAQMSQMLVEQQRFNQTILEMVGKRETLLVTNPDTLMEDVVAPPDEALEDLSAVPAAVAPAKPPQANRPASVQPPQRNRNR